jgi:hypothetical protein
MDSSVPTSGCSDDEECSAITSTTASGAAITNFAVTIHSMEVSAGLGGLLDPITVRLSVSPGAPIALPIATLTAYLSPSPTSPPAMTSSPSGSSTLSLDIGVGFGVGVSLGILILCALGVIIWNQRRRIQLARASNQALQIAPSQWGQSQELGQRQEENEASVGVAYPQWPAYELPEYYKWSAGETPVDKGKGL